MFLGGISFTKDSKVLGENFPDFRKHLLMDLIYFEVLCFLFFWTELLTIHHAQKKLLKTRLLSYVSVYH